MTVSVIVPTFNRPLLLAALLRVLAAELQPGDEVLVVDDGSSPPLSPTDVPGVSWLRCPHNAGPSVARNLGASASRGEMLLFLDDDVLPQPGFLSAVRQFMADNPSLMVGVGSLIPLEDNLFSRFWYERYQTVFQLDPVPMFSSGCGFVRRLLLQRPEFQPLFCPQLRTREDFELYLRLQAAGIPVARAPRAVAANRTRRGLREFLQQGYGYWQGQQQLARLRSVPLSRPRLWPRSPSSWLLAGLLKLYILGRSWRERCSSR